MSASVQLELIDVLVIVGSLATVFLAGIVGARRTSTAGDADYVLAGRSLTMPFFVASLVATWYGAVLASGEFVMRYGLVFIFCFGIPYYVVAMVYASWLAKRVRQSKAVSIPDQMGIVYGPRARTASAIVMLIITVPASYQLMLGIVVQSITGLSLLLSIVIGTVISVVYVVKGGLRSDVFANVVQLIVLYSGFIALATYCIIVYGSPVDLLTSLPQTHTTIPSTLGWMPILVWFVVALQTFIDPNFHVRAAAAKDANTARRGIFVSVGMWMVFDAMQLLTGLYAVANLDSVVPTDTYIALAQSVLPSMWKGLFIAGVIAAVMSSLDGYALVSATTIGHDLIDVWRKREPRVASLRLGLAITAVTGIVAAWCIPSIIDLIYQAASIVVPTLLLPLLISFTRYARRFAHVIVPIIVTTALASLVSLLSGTGEPMIIGLSVSLVLHSLQLLRREPTVN